MAALIFSCANCHTPFTIDEEHLGTEVTCPSCDEDNVLPTAEEYFGADTVVGMEPLVEIPPPRISVPQTPAGLPKILKDEDWTRLAASDLAVYNACYDWSARESWQFALMAAMLRSRLTTLRARVHEPIEYTRTLSLFRSRPKINEQMTIRANRFIYMTSSLNQQIGTYLWYTLFQNGLEPSYAFFAKVDPWIEQLANFHRGLGEMPQFNDSPEVDMQESMEQWVPWIWQSLDRLATRLDADSHKHQVHDSRIRLQISLQPPFMHEFFIAQSHFIS